MKNIIKKPVDVGKDYNGIKIKNIHSFYIDNINDKFFTSLNNHPNRYFVNKVLPKIQKNFDKYELEKFNELDNLTKNNKIKLMLNLALKKIASKTGTDKNELFNSMGVDRFGEHLYIKELLQSDSNKVLSDSNLDRKYEYLIEINPNCYLYEYISELQLSFFFENETKMLSGGFSLNKVFANKKGIDFSQTINSIYFYSLIKHYVTKQLHPISLNNMLDIIETVDDNKNKNKKVIKKTKLNAVDFKQISIEQLHDNWIDFINRKYLNFITINTEQKKHYENTLFYSVLIVNIIMLTIYEELRLYFTNERPELILYLLDKPVTIKSNSNQDSETDFYEIAKFLQHNYVDKNKIIKWNKIKNYQDILDTLIEQKSYDLNSFGKQITTIELYRKENEPFISEQQILTTNNKLRLIYLMVISPELFGMDESTGYFIEFKQFNEIVNKNTFQKFKMSESLSEKIEKSLCELNYDFITFISNEPSMLIIKNNTISNNEELFAEHNFTSLYENYFWSQIYVQSRMWKRMHIEAEFNYDVEHKIDVFHKQKLDELETLLFSWYDNFYGMPEIDHIINKINELSDLKKSIEMLIIEIRQKDELSKKDKERTSILFAYIIASLIGFINFFGMVYTILTVDDPSAGLITENIIVISVGTLIVLILLIILISFGVKVLKTKFNNNS